jgi:hypothetical protein
MTATPSAIESAVSDEASARCSMFRQAIFQKDIVDFAVFSLLPRHSAD